MSYRLVTITDQLLLALANISLPCNFSCSEKGDIACETC